MIFIYHFLWADRLLILIISIIVVHLNCNAKYDTIILSNEKPLSEQLKNTDTKYIIKTDIIIDSDITIPDNSILSFDGGSIKGRNKLVGRNTQIEAGLSEILGTDLLFDGTWNIRIIYPEWFGAIPNIPTGNCSNGIQKAIEFSTISKYSKTVGFQGARYYCKDPIKLKAGKNYYLQGYGDATLVASGGNIYYLLGRDGSNSSDAKSLKLNMRDLTFDANYRCDFSIYMPSMSNSSWYNVNCISAIICNYFTNYSFINNFYGCKFYSGDPYGHPTKYGVYMGNQACNAILFNGCAFEGAQIGVFSDNGYNVVFSSCTFEGLRATGLYINRTECCVIENCYFEDVSWHRETKDISSKRYINPADLGVCFTQCRQYTSMTNNNNAHDLSIKPVIIHANVIQNSESLQLNSDLHALTLAFRHASNKSSSGRYSGKKFIVRGSTFQHIKTKGIENDCNVFSCGSECMQVCDNSSEAIDIVNGLGRFYVDYKPQNIIIPTLGGMIMSFSYSSSHNANHSEIDDGIFLLELFRE